MQNIAQVTIMVTMSIFRKSDTTITITTSTILKAILLTVIAWVTIMAISSITHQLRLIFISLLLAIGLNPAVGAITRRIRSKSRIRATGAAYVIVITIMVAFLAIVVPPIVRQTSDFVRGVPDSLNNLKHQDSAFARTIRRYNLEDRLDQIRDSYVERLGDVSEPVINTAGRVGGTIVSIITVLILTFMMLVEGPMWLEKFIALQPEKKRQKRKEVVGRMYKVVTGFVNGQVLIAFIAAVFAAVVLLIMNAVFGASVNPIALAGITFVFALIPLIGNMIGASIVVLVCLLSSAPLALFMAGYFIVYQQIENATLQPYIQSRSNQLTPLTVFVAALIGGSLAGILGALAAIPLAGCVKILLDEYVIGRFPDLDSFDKHIKRT